jgi:hypothetical protein
VVAKEHSQRDTITKYGKREHTIRPPHFRPNYVPTIRARSTLFPELRMENFFTPAQRLAIEPLDCTDVQLAVSIETFLNHRWDWSAFYAFATDDEGEIWKLLWITENTFICVEDVYTEEHSAILRATFTATNGETHELVVLAIETESTSLAAEVSSVFWHAVTTSNCVKLRLEHWSSWFIVLCSGAALLQFLEASPSLELLDSEDFDFEEPTAVLLQLWRERISRSLLSSAFLTLRVQRTLSSDGFGTAKS